jgi:hypothetical protein
LHLRHHGGGGRDQKAGGPLRYLHDQGAANGRGRNQKNDFERLQFAILLKLK